MSTYNALIGNVELLLSVDKDLLILKGVTKLMTKVYEDSPGIKNLKITVTDVKEGKLIKCEVNGND